MATETYTRTVCTSCNGTGEKHDATCADKVNAGPYVGQCPKCRGCRYVYKLDSEHVRQMEAERIERLAAPVVVSEIPEWML